eukprot:gene1620-1879_t
MAATAAEGQGGALAQALAEWRALLGAQRVLDDDPTLAAYASSTASWSTLPAAVLRPHTRGEVEALVRIAAARRIALYPVSTGRNWGYGDACAPGAGQVIVDLADAVHAAQVDDHLSGMNRIREVDARLAYV